MATRSPQLVIRLLRWLALLAASAAALCFTGPAAAAPAGPAPSALVRTVVRTVVRLDAGVPAPGPFEPGNLLDYAESDFEGSAGTGGWISVSNATLSQSTTQAYLHDDSLEDQISAAGASVYQLGGDIQTTVVSGDTYSVGAYFKAPAASGRTISWGLDFYNSSGDQIGWVRTTDTDLSPSGDWQYVAGTITAPAHAAYVLNSPEVTYGGAAGSETIYMDEAALTPYRAAQIIGAHGDSLPGTVRYVGKNWITADDTIGPLQSDKEFYRALPHRGQDDSPSFKATICYQIEKLLPAGTPYPACLIAYTDQNETKAQVAEFVQSIPASQMVIMIFCQEPEGPHLKSCAGGSASGFQKNFARQSGYIRAAGDFPNVFVAMDAEAYQYAGASAGGTGGVTGGGSNEGGGNGIGCGFIPPAAEVDLYLEDHYEGGPKGGHPPTGKDLPASGSPYEQEWTNWLQCVAPAGKPIGLAEYGLNQTSPVLTNADALAADNTYLEHLPESGGLHAPLLLWEYWWNGGDQFPPAPPASPQATQWVTNETQNGGW